MLAELLLHRKGALHRVGPDGRHGRGPVGDDWKGAVAVVSSLRRILVQTPADQPEAGERQERYHSAHHMRFLLFAGYFVPPAHQTFTIMPSNPVGIPVAVTWLMLLLNSEPGVRIRCGIPGRSAFTTGVSTG